MTEVKILIFGATGYIGGSVLASLIKSSDSKIRDCKITAPVRKELHAARLRDLQIESPIFEGLDDLDFIQSIASSHDIVINAASTFYPGVAKAIVQGLEKRQKLTGRQGHLLQTSGTGSVADRRTSQRLVENKVLSDKDDIYEYLKFREHGESFPQRLTDVTTIEAGDAMGVKTYILMSPTIYGPGKGLFNRKSMQIQALVDLAFKEQYTSVVGSGDGEWNHVHIEDMCSLYELIVSRLLKGDELPSNKKGIYFNETGSESWLTVSRNIGKVGKQMGLLPTEEVTHISLEEASTKLSTNLMANISVDVIELGWASWSRTKADLAREIGWTPTKTRDDFLATFKELWVEAQEANSVK
ncbi:NAD dependent epimerase/dehydratase family protein [Truncatella angustata]|uniref:NAD dependent epimerase/dehydratase family protein n=1 Tax=Truncatella angustata TaxID=152316 RepID=A0A9P8RJ74_9PEZI|nr:NAD dependent epimerase/dehydratase family protein [Truncatella angustata]KAH6645313.1 NAD dependent epimerase/dehydratase family protein [Truncatella angustata]KAH8203317.1 hypothetical protein TruAng_002513 [Truncatella angustata]